MNARVKYEMKNTIARAKEEQKYFEDYEARIDLILTQKEASLREEVAGKCFKEESEVNRCIAELKSQKEELGDCQTQLSHLQDLLNKGQLSRGSRRCAE